MYIEIILFVLIILIILLIHKYQKEIFSFIESFESSKITLSAEDKQYILCLTTTPKRINLLNHTLESIQKQTIQPTLLILNIPHFSKRFKTKYTIPDFINKNEYPNLVIIRCDDYGPATKILPTLEFANKKENHKDYTHLFSKKMNDVPIIFIDDDQYYHEKMSEYFLIYSKQQPNNTLCMRGGIIKRHKPLYRIFYDSYKIKEPLNVHIFSGWKGVFVKSRFLAIFIISCLLSCKEPPTLDRVMG